MTTILFTIYEVGLMKSTWHTEVIDQIKSTLHNWGLCQPATILTAHVDGYGDFGDELTKEMRLAAARPATSKKQSPEIKPEEFESVYGWFYS